MRKHLSFLGICLTLSLLAACGHSGSDRADTVTVPTSTTVKAVKAGKGGFTQPQIDAGLLAVQDMPTGFSVSPTSKSDDTTPSGCAAFDSVKDPKQDAIAKGEVTFTKGTFGPFVGEAVATQTPSRAKEYFDSFSSAIKSCASFDSTGTDGTKTTYKLAPLSFPKLGDDTLAVRLSTDGAGLGSLGVDIAVIRLGDSYVLISNGVLGLPDTTITEATARKAIEKMQSVK